MNSTQDRFYLNAQHPVLRDHVVHGRHVLPGLAYVDLLYQTLREQGLDHLGWSLRNVSIYHPLSIAADEELLIEIDSRQIDATNWRIEIHGQDMAGGTRRRYCSAQVSATGPVQFDETLDLEAILASGAERTSLDRVYEQCRSHGLVHGGFMQPRGARYATADAIYIDCAVDPSFAPEGMELMFHPALLDGCAIGLSSVVDATGDGALPLFLPIAIESFRASHLLSDRCVARIRTDRIKLQQDLCSLSLEFFDECGAKVAELTNLTTKAIRDPARLDRSPARDEGATGHTPAPRITGATPAPERSPAPAAGDDRRAPWQAFLQRIVAQRLGVSTHQVDVRAGFYDLGLDSASLLELVQLVEGRLQVPLSPTLLFEHTSVDALAEHLSASYGAPAQDTTRASRAGSVAPAAAGGTVEAIAKPVAVAAPPIVRESAPLAAGSETDIAVIGMAGRFPQALDVRELWANLLAAKDCITEVPASRWDWHLLDRVKSASGKDMSRWGGFIAEADCFDAEFFRILPRDAELMDPQERQFLEVAWSAIEDAGYTPATLADLGEDGRRRPVGVFAGAMHKDYALVGAQRLQDRQVLPLSLSAGMIANRVSYFCNFHGPSITIDTVCSSSLTAVHLALESVRHGECEVALAGGVNLSLHPAKYLTYGMADMHASDGRCRSFGAGGDGYVSAEGVGVVVLKPLRRARADRDAVYAVVKGSAVNHVGAVGGASVPSPTAQADMIGQCLRKAGVDARSIGYVEAHGTGTSLGDPIEIEGLGKAFRRHTQDVGFCAIGSLKSNIGHAEAAAGVAGLIKAVLQLEHRTLVASLHAQTLNPHIDWQRSPFVVQTRTEKWRRSRRLENGQVVVYPRRAALSSFGATGSNAHVILEEYRAPREALQHSAAALVVLSARNAERLRAQAQRLLAHLERDDVPLSDLAYTLQVGRQAFDHRLAIVAADAVQLKARLAAFVETGTVSGDEDGFVGECRQHRDAVGLLTDDEDSAELVAKWLAKGKLRKLAQLWIKGFSVDWKRLYGQGAPRRVHLPGYAFARPRYWLPDAEPAPAMPTATAAALMPDAATPQALLLTPQWEPASLAAAAVTDGEQWILFAGWRSAVQGDAWPSARVETLAADGDEAERFARYGWQLLQRVQTWLQDRPRAPLRIQLVIPAGEATLYALAGLLKTAQQEQPLLRGQVIGVEDVSDTPWLAAQLARCAASEAAELRYADGLWQARHFRPLVGSAPVQPWKRGGVYLITGGGGGLGRRVAEAIEREVGTATVVLVGRGEPAGLPSLGGLTVDCRRVDVADAAAVGELIAGILARHGRLDGIVHSAGVIRDGFLLRKSEAQYREVLAPKVRGVVNLDRATRHLALDSFVLFSSATGAYGNVGQGDYALANAFLDAYAQQRAQAVARGECRGHSVSIGWPLWAEGGMQVGAERREALRAVGADAMPTAQGIEALYQAYGSGAAQVQVLYGMAPALMETHAKATRAEPARQAEASEVRPRTLQQLRRLFGAVTKLDAAQIDVAEPLESYGIDSIVIMQLNTRLTGVFGELSKTLFFEYPTLAELGDYLVRDHHAACVRWCGLDEPAAVPATAVASAVAVVSGAAVAPPPGSARAAAVVSAAPATSATDVSSEPARPVSQAVAVIGLAGRYPQARDIDSYWDNLREGRDGIREIPAERWPIEGFFEPDMERAIASGRSYGKWGGFIDGFAEFDALFFNISPREAMNVDPQERLFLETCWAAMEDAGYTRERFATAHQRRVGVFAGITRTGFDLYGPELWRRGETLAPSTSFGSLANRVSYALNLQGPSMPVDTMCSASLTAIHEACQHLLRDECELAFAGGVNLYLHPANYAMLCSSRMLSASGRCHSFGAGGDGFVPGEGIGVALLKPLARAVADRDPIHGVIRATGINHDGKTNGYTVPNPVAQRELIASVLAKAGIDARTVSYIEAHGTGTSLGDPIEITGLTQAFARHTADTQFCAIGSVKSNIGHAEAAAGIAGLTKVLLQMKHRQLAPSLHAETLNPNIDFSTTPFVVQRTLADWRRPQVTLAGVTREYPRIAGISSFGAGGANAHVIVEEYVATAAAPFTRTVPVLCVLSARSEERLKARAQQLLDAIHRRGLADADLADIAYTLQVGREAMDHRLAFTADTLAALSGLLQRYVGGDTAIDGLHRGEVKRNKDALSALTEDDEFDETIAKWLARGKYAKVLDLWVKGLAFDWTRLYPQDTPRIIALPTYPFAPETHWLPLGPTAAVPADAAVTQLHPLLHANTSTLAQQRYSSRFTGDEFFLADHRVHGERMLPGVAYLEMAQQAVHRALEVDDGTLALKAVVWVRPLRVNAPLAVHVSLDPLESGEVAWEVYTQADDEGGSGGERIVHAQGRVALVAPVAHERVDLAALGRCCEIRVDASACYDVFDATGVSYGPAHRGIRSLQIGADDNSPFVLAQLALPDDADAPQGSYVLHPGILDSALQASIGFVLGTASAGTSATAGAQAAMPFSVDEIEILGATPLRGFALVRDRTLPGTQTQKLDVYVCDEQGDIRVRLRGFVCRALASPKAPSAEVAAAAHAVTSLLLPRWEAVASPFAEAWPAPHARVLIVGGSVEQQHAMRQRHAHAHVLDAAADSAVETLAAALAAHNPIDHIVWIASPLWTAPEEDQLIEAQETGVIALFRLVKALLAGGYGARPLGWTVLTTQSQQIDAADVADPAHAGIHGFVGSLAKEYAHWPVRLVDIPAGESGDVDEWLRLPADPNGDAWAYRAGEWFQQQLLRFEPAAVEATTFRDGGVYVMIGGAGGIGQVFSEYLVRQHRANIVWIGRRPVDEEIEQSMRRLSALGPAPLYLQADAADRDDLARAHREIRARHDRIDGVVHSAIVLLDKSLANMEEGRLRTALRAKVDVCVRIAQVFAGEPLDFVLFFSALQSFVKQAGQSNYAAGCTFKDAFAHALNAAWPCAVKIVNWGFWGTVGTVSSEYYQQRMQQAGIGSIEPDDGLRALQALFAARVPQLAVVKTLSAQAQAQLQALELPASTGSSAVVMPVEVAAIPAELIADDTVRAWQAEFDRQQLTLLYAQLQHLGLFDAPLPAPTAGSVRRWFAASGLRAMYERWMLHSVHVLTEAGLLRESDEGLVPGFGAPADMAAAWSQWDERCVSWRAQPGLGAQIGVVDATLRALPDVLTGRRLATDLLFPQSKMSSVEGFYRRNALADYFNTVLADSLVAQFRDRLAQDPQRRLRILEIGAGTGGTSALVFDKLRPFASAIDEYTYTDISKSFLMHAEEQFAADAPYLRCRLFNVEQPLRSQSIDIGSYDFVIATNVLHATRNIRTTLRNAKAALHHGGLLLLNEMNRFSLVAHLTFGLTEGWWLFDDDALRIPGTPALDPAAWRRVLEGEGFEALQFPAESAHDLGQQIVVARSDGAVLQAPVKARPQSDASVRDSRPAPVAHDRPAAAAPAPVRAAPAAPAPAQRVQPDRAGQEEFVRRTIAETIANALKVSVDLVDADEPFADYGLDSILGVHAVHVISEKLGISLNTTALFDYSTVTKLSAHILAEHALRADIGAVAVTSAEPVVDDSRAAAVASAAPLRSRFAVASNARSATAVPAVAPAVAPVAATPTDVGGPRPPLPATAAHEPIAIVGMSARYPHCDDVEQLWRHLASGDDLIDAPGEGRGLPRGVVSGIDQFDALFFNISGLEATFMDPQQRLFLEESWKALEDAGYVGDAIEGSRCGVYLGSTTGDYSALMPQANIPPQAFWGNSGAITPARISYFLDLQGPAVAIDTACSSSLVAMHMGCLALRAGEVALALAGGVFIQSSPAFQASAGNAGMLSPNGRCYTFDDRADGFVASEGVGVVVLK
ncbi:SDR family NAD(P)-dependent oxidoreductase, partial [Tahibacter sp.]|uniref:SDR family NAD(P)-dependent oxidoreductase n=1 Tax=Tahibacter sp. TaxID=2056211 RepID=UPI0028C47175